MIEAQGWSGGLNMHEDNLACTSLGIAKEAVNKIMLSKKDHSQTQRQVSRPWWAWTFCGCGLSGL